MEKKKKSTTRTRPGDGPRSLVLHPNREFLYLTNELTSTITVFAVNPATGSLAEVQRISTIPPDFVGESFPAEVAITPNGRFLYTSNRGHDSMACFEIEAEGGLLRLVGFESTRGEWPRHFSLSPDGRHLLVANQFSHNVVVFLCDPNTGRLTATGSGVDVPSPTCVQII